MPTPHLDALAKNMEGDSPDPGTDELKKWKKKVNSQELFDHFGAEGIDVVSLDSLSAFIKEAETHRTLTDFEKEIQVDFDSLTKIDPDERLKADGRLQSFIRYLQQRNIVVSKQRRDLLKFKVQNPESAPIITSMYEKATSIGGSLARGFGDAPFHEKAAMLAGVYITSMMVWRGWNWLTNKNDADKPHMLRDIAGLGLGLGGIYLAAEAVNKTVERTRGAPIWNAPQKWWHVPDLQPGQSGYKERLIKEEAAQTTAALSATDLPPDLFGEYDSDEKEKYIYALTNIGTLTVEQFEELYERGKVSKKLTKDEPYPARPFRDDKLSLTERFVVLEDVGETLGLIDATHEIIKPGNWEKRRKLTIMSLAFDHIPLDDAGSITGFLPPLSVLPPLGL
ncbi:hypothetical protein A3F36_00675 [Candidatus Peribacteria bacterium RIFCSPHIGHO2_12_FULL_55_11]|nr:MAG: hypothetical protein A3F36_00675 [Candidatus Peribacteria bacterium RIFCSPHIGHO2_12_FULL_55_11]